MTLHVYMTAAGGSAFELTPYINMANKGWHVTCNAEQGSVGTNTFEVEDITGVLNIIGHHRIWAIEDSAAVGHQMIFWGYAAARDIDRVDPAVGVSRKWTVTVTDVNSLLDRKVMVGSNARPAETDVARIQWLMTTGEAGNFDDTTTYVSTAGPVDMDALPDTGYTGQMFNQVIDDCAQQSGKNYYVRFPYDGGISDYRAAIWYGADSLAAAASTLRISNVLSDVDSSITWAPVSEPTKLNRDPSRVYSGVFGNYDGGTVYQHSQTIQDAFANRDTTAQWPNVKTATKAIARANRYLADLNSEEDVISTSILVTPSHVNDAMAGDSIDVKFSHLPNYEAFVTCRILNRTVTWVTPERYQIDYELTPISEAASGDRLLVAIINIGGAGGAPADLSTHAWTKVFWSADYASALQFPGPGGSAQYGMWVRAVVPGESATVIQTSGRSSQTNSVWVLEIEGITLAGMTSSVATEFTNYDNIRINSTSAASASVWLSTSVHQCVNYGQFIALDTEYGNKVFWTNGSNQVGVCHDNNTTPPMMWCAWAQGTGVLQTGYDVSNGSGCNGATPDYNGWGRAFGGLLFPLTGTFSILKQGFNATNGADVAVTLPSPP